MPRISIIIPNRNYAKFLPDCLESVRSQTTKDWECIVVDDASTDKSQDIIQKYCDCDKRFRMIKHNESRGISAARNAGLDAALGDYIAFLDSDDCYLESGLELLLNLAESTNADMVGAQTIIVPDNFKFSPISCPAVVPAPFSWATKSNVYISLGKSFNWCWVWRRIYKRDLIAETRFCSEFTSLGDDLDFMLNICHKANRMIETPAASTYHRLHGASITQKKFGRQHFEFFPIMYRRIKENLLDKYDRDFWTFYFNDTFKYLITETVFRPSRHRAFQTESRDTLRQSVRLIPKKYLTLKNRIFAWVLQW